MKHLDDLGEAELVISIGQSSAMLSSIIGYKHCYWADGWIAWRNAEKI
jgi:hypothetical protein